jgi:hypothetical protein
MINTTFFLDVRPSTPIRRIRFFLLNGLARNSFKLLLIILLMIATLPAKADIKEVLSTSESCEWTYVPGKAVIEYPDSINPKGVFLQWNDTDFRICEHLLQPMRIFYVVLPPNTSPQFQILSVQAMPDKRGLPGRSPRLEAKFERISETWGEIAEIESWRGFRLAKVLIYPQLGNEQNSQILTSIRVRVSFQGNPGRIAPTPRDRELLSSIALNGHIAAQWWSEPQTRQRFDDLNAWPNLALHRLIVTETGLYKIAGDSPEISEFIGQPSNRIKLFGNGGKLLPYTATDPIDTALTENSIWVDDGGDGIFDRQDTILFFGKGLKGFDYCAQTQLANDAHQNPYTTENVYFLGIDPSGSNGLRMAPLSTGSDANALVVDTSLAYAYYDEDVFINAGGDQPQSGVVWYGTTLGSGQTRTFGLTLEAPTPSPARFTVDMASVDYVSFGFSIYVNDARMDTGFNGVVHSRDIPRNRLNEGNNYIYFHNYDPGTVYVNYFLIQYTRMLTTTSGSLEFIAPNRSGLFSYTVGGLGNDSYVLEIADPLHPRMARGNHILDSSSTSRPHRYYALNPSKMQTPQFRGLRPAQATQTLDYERLRSPQNSAGLIIITFDDGYDALDSLKTFHESYREEPLRTVRVRLSDIYDEFGWGVKDIMTIRNFLHYAYDNWRGSTGNEEPPKYCLLVGDGNYDYRGLEPGLHPNLMPPWEWGAEAYDDFYASFAGSRIPQLLMGRFPVQNADELRTVVRKTIQYATQPLYGPWKNTASFAADDEWKDGGCGETDHTLQAEGLTRSILPDYFTFKKIYEIFYPFRSSPVGPVKPDATRDLIEAFNRGTLIVHFAGHGNEHVWTDEQLFVMDRDKNLLTYERTWPLFVAATCSWGAYDRTASQCFPEGLLKETTGGSIAGVAATRFTFIGPNDNIAYTFYSNLFRPGLASRRSFGEALLAAKSINASSSELYHCLGDPVLRLATPEYFSRVTSASDSLQALSLYHLSGEVARSDTGGVWQDFNGVVEARVFDTEDSLAYYWCGHTNEPPEWIMQPGNAIFRGTATVTNGRFNVTFRVPRDVRYGGTNAKVSLYFYGKGAGSDSADGVGIREHLPIASLASSERDSVAPRISAWLEYPSFRPGDLVSATPKLHVGLSDSSGINLSGEVGHKITGRVDDSQAEDLTPFFNYDRDSYTTGGLDKTIGPLPEGEHRLVIEAWDAFNNLSQTQLTLTVGKSGEAGFDIRDVLAYPNPMKDVVNFTYFLTQAGTRRVQIKIFTLTGKLVYQLDNLSTRGPAFNSNADRPWDGRDREGHVLANGVYLYKVRAEHENGHTAEAVGKLVILR